MNAYIQRRRAHASISRCKNVRAEMGNPLPADDGRDLTQGQADCLRKVAATRGTSTQERYVLPDDVHDALVEKGYIRWERGVLLITASGILALARDLTQKP